MITIRHYPVRFEKKGSCVYTPDYVPGKPVSEYLKTLKLPATGHCIILEGKLIRPDHVLKDNDDIILTPSLGDPISAIIGTIVSFIAIHQILTLAVVGIVALAAYAVYAAVSAGSRRPSFGSLPDIQTQGGLDESSPTYGWDGIRTIQEVGAPVKVVYGRHRTGGNIINQFITTDGDKQYLNLLIGLCEGEINAVSDVLLNDNPIENFDGISSVIRYGTNDQTTIPNFEDLHNVYAVNANLVKDNAYVYTTVDNDVEGFDIYLNLPGGLFQASGGSIVSWQVDYQVEYKIHGDSVYTDLGVQTIEGKSRSAIRRIFSKRGLTAAQYDIRITRTSDDSQLDPQKQGDLTLASVDEIKTDDLVYPNTALYGVKALATEQLSGSTPNLTFLIEGKKVSIPAVLDEEGGDPVDWEDYYYDPDDEVFRLFTDDSELYWDGTTYEDRWSANPIWCLKDLQLNTRYGMGEFIELENINAAQLLEMALICEEKISDGAGGYEKRFRLDVVLDSAGKVPDVLTQLTAAFRAFSFYSDKGFSFRIDREEDPVQVFGMGNIVKNSFEQRWKSRSEVFNLIEVQFMDQDLDYQQESIAVMDQDSVDSGEPIRKKTIRVYTTKKSYAIREGKYALALSKYINRTATIRCGIDAIACQAGDRVDISHDVPQWGYSGRVRSGSTTTVIKLDRSVVIAPGKSYNIVVRGADDSIIEKAIITSPGTYTEVEVSEAFAEAPAEYSVYLFGEVDLVYKPFRVIGVKRESAGEVLISAVEYNESIYDDSGVVIPTSNYSAISSEIPAITGLSLTERIVRVGDGTIEDVIDVWFDKPDMTRMGLFSKARIYISDNDGASWTYRGETYSTHFAIMGDLIEGAEYKVAVVSTDYTGRMNPINTSPDATLTLVGKSAPPSDVTTFLVNQSRDRLTFGWSEVTDLDLLGYEIRTGESWEAGTIIATQLKTTQYTSIDFRTGSGQKFFIKAIDTSGNYSETETEATVTVENIPFTNIIVEYNEETGWAGNKSDVSKVGDNLELDAGELVGTYETPVRDVGYVANFKIGINAIVVDASSDLTFDGVGEATFADDPLARFSGQEVAGATAFEIKTSEDNVTWSEWLPWQAGDYKCRYFQLRMTLTRATVAQTIRCTSLNYYADLPDVDERGASEVLIADDGAEVLFTKTFHEAPSVNVDILSGDGFVHKFSVVPTITGFTVKLYELDGTPAVGDFSFHAHGV